MKYIKYYEAIEKDFDLTIFTTPDFVILENKKESFKVSNKDLGILKRYNVNFYKYFLDLKKKKHINAVKYAKKFRHFNKFLDLYVNKGAWFGLDYLLKQKQFEKSSLLNKWFDLNGKLNNGENIGLDTLNSVKAQFLKTYFNIDLDTFNHLFLIEDNF